MTNSPELNLLGRLLVGTSIAGLILGSVALAGPPPEACDASCTDLLGSDILIFNQGDPNFEIEARLTECTSCAVNAMGDIDFVGEAMILFGTYDPGLVDGDGNACDPAKGDLLLSITSPLRLSSDTGGPGGDEPVYSPANPTEIFVPLQPYALFTSCMDAANLDYRIPRVYLTDVDGARTGSVPMAELPAVLRLPESVRASSGGAPVSDLEIDVFRFSQGLAFTHDQTAGASLRLWPDGLPFRLNPGELLFSPDNVDVETPAPSPYAWAPPDDSNLAANPNRVHRCDGQGQPCTTNDAVSNVGYLAHPNWLPTNASISKVGLAVDLALEGSENVIYEPVFPSGFAVELSGPGAITIDSSQIQHGTFHSGELRLEPQRQDPCSDDPGRQHRLLSAERGPQIGPGGSLLAAVEDLNDNLDIGGSSPVLWARSTNPGNESGNETTNLGCGTFYVPPVMTALSPNFAWHQSAVPTVLDRGLYTGINYNRNRVCKDSGGVTLQKFCTVDSDCDTGQGESCVDGGFSPLCPEPTPLDPAPHWLNVTEGEELHFDIDPDLAGHGDREMAFVLRRSGVTGVFDGGDDDFDFNPGFQFNVDTFGLAYKESRSEGADTIFVGELKLKWPSLADIPFDEMSICNCGMMEGARTPDYLFSRKLAYWDQTFFPYGLSFVPSGDDCDLTGSTCGQATQADKVCIQALTPIPRFEPDPEAVFDVDTTGQPGTLTPYSVSELEFDEDDVAVKDGYVYHVEDFQFSSHSAAGQPSSDDVLTYGNADYGYVASRGDIGLPFFGLTPAGIKIELDHAATWPLAATHTECDELSSPLCSELSTPQYFPATRKMAADSVTLPFAVDYISPDKTSDTNDGTSEPRKGQGALFAFADAVNLGSATAAAGMMLRPSEIVGGEGELGPAAAMRLWGNVKGTQSERAALLEPILTPARLGVLTAAYDDALADLTLETTQVHLWPSPSLLEDALHDTGAINRLGAHPDAGVVFEVDSSPPGESPPLLGTKATGYLDFSSDDLEMFLLSSNMDTGGEFFAMDSSQLSVDRHAKEGEEPISILGRVPRPGASNNMKLQGEQDVPFDEGSPAKNDIGGGNDLMSWVFDYDMVPSFQFVSLTGSVDLAKAGMSGVGIDRMGMTLKFYADGDWYFIAGFEGTFDGYGAEGDILFGNTKEMTLLRDIDPEVANFLEGITTFDGVYLAVGVTANAPIIDFGCLLRVNGGMKVGGWFISDSFGGRVTGTIYGRGACVVDIKGSMTLMGGEVGDVYKVGGNFWAAGGIGFCSPGDWDTPADVLDDDFCAACVGYIGMTGTFPPEDLDIEVDGPEFDCAL